MRKRWLSPFPTLFLPFPSRRCAHDLMTRPSRSRTSRYIRPGSAPTAARRLSGGFGPRRPGPPPRRSPERRSDHAPARSNSAAGRTIRPQPRGRDAPRRWKAKPARPEPTSFFSSRSPPPPRRCSGVAAFSSFRSERRDPSAGSPLHQTDGAVGPLPGTPAGGRGRSATWQPASDRGWCRAGDHRRAWRRRTSTARS